MRQVHAERPPVSTICWPPPLPGRVGWSWLLRLPWRRRRIRRILSMLDGRVAPGSLLVDVGGGTGVGAEEAARRAPRGTYRRLIVVDPQRGMLAGLRPRTHASDPVDAVRADGVRLPLEDRSVDVVLCLGVLCCVTDAAVPLAVAEMWRVLRPRGLAVVTVPLRRGDADDPILRAQGFVPRARLRPGRSLYERPISEPHRSAASPPA